MDAAFAICADHDALAAHRHGLAFLPASSVKKEVKARRLVRAAEPGQYELNMELRMYRERQGATRRVKPVAQALWNFLTHADADRA